MAVSRQQMKSFTELIRGFTYSSNQITPIENSPDWDSKVHEYAESVGTRIVTSLNKIHSSGPITRTEFFEQTNQLLCSLLQLISSKPISSILDTRLTSVHHLVESLIQLVNQQLTLHPQMDHYVISGFWLFIDWLTHGKHLASSESSNQLDPTLNLTYFQMGLKLFGQILQHMDSILMAHAKLALNTEFSHQCQFDMSELVHPISPLLLSASMQLVTEKIEAFANFLYQALTWKDDKNDNSFLTYFESSIQDQSRISWRISLTIAFAGICLPEWTTTEACLRLACLLLTKLTNPTQLNLATRHHDDLLLSDQFLFDIHASILLVFSKGSLPRRLTCKYGEFYGRLGSVNPIGQFELLHTMIGCSSKLVDQTKELQVQQSVHQQAVRQIVLEAIRHSSVTERENFASGICRSLTKPSTIQNHIAAFVNSCATK